MAFENGALAVAAEHAQREVVGVLHGHVVQHLLHVGRDGLAAEGADGRGGFGVG